MWMPVIERQLFCSAPAGVLKQGSCVYAKCQFARSSSFIGQGFCFACTAQLHLELGGPCGLKRKWWKEMVWFCPLFWGGCSPLISKRYGSTGKEAPLLCYFPPALWGGGVATLSDLSRSMRGTPLKRQNPSKNPPKLLRSPFRGFCVQGSQKRSPIYVGDLETEKRTKNRKGPKKPIKIVFF